MKIKLIVCGNGALAKAILDYDVEGGQDFIIEKFNSSLEPAWECNEHVAIHVGHGRQLPELITYCEKYNIPLIQASTGMTLPEGFRIPIINAPNLAIPIIAVLKNLPPLIDGITKGIGLDVTEKYLAETHQATKKSVPGTAKKIAEIVGIPASEVFSQRNPIMQSMMGVPREHLNRHAYHFLKLMFAGGIEIGLYTKVHGLKPYVVGAVVLAQRIVELSPIPGPYTP